MDEVEIFWNMPKITLDGNTSINEKIFILELPMFKKDEYKKIITDK